VPDWTDPDDTERFHKCSDDRIHASGAMMTGSFVSSMINPEDWTKVKIRKKTASTTKTQRLSGSFVGPLNDSDSAEGNDSNVLFWRTMVTCSLPSGFG
jgi:hypothetical protein